MKKNDLIGLIEILKNTYPEAKCSLNFTTPFELVVAVMLSAQCTDARVNQITPSIFCKYSTPEDFANISLENLEELIRPCGFYKNKAKNIKACAIKILTNYNGKVPNSLDKLVSLPGIGRKSANVIMLEVFGVASGIAVDTHVKRISNRIGLSSNSDPIKIEQDLLNIIPKKYIKDVNHLFIYFGRHTCTARSPKCEQCKIKHLCKTYLHKSI